LRGDSEFHKLLPDDSWDRELSYAPIRDWGDAPKYLFRIFESCIRHVGNTPFYVLIHTPEVT